MRPLERKLINGLSADDFVVVTYSLPSEFKKENKELSSVFVRKRIAVTKAFTLKGVKLGTSLFAVKVPDIAEFEKMFVELYGENGYDFRILGPMDKAILLSAVENILDDAVLLVNTFFNSFDKTSPNAKERLTKFKSKLNVIMNRLWDYEKVSSKQYAKRSILLEAVAKRAKYLSEL